MMALMPYARVEFGRVGARRSRVCTAIVENAFKLYSVDLIGNCRIACENGDAEILKTSGVVVV